jgi:hypothetical protein
MSLSSAHAAAAAAAAGQQNASQADKVHHHVNAKQEGRKQAGARHASRLFCTLSRRLPWPLVERCFFLFQNVQNSQMKMGIINDTCERIKEEFSFMQNQYHK